ncbi:MAG: fumarylacetoacetase [Comamonas sp.]
MHTIDFALRTFVPGAQESEFPLQNLPYGIFSTAATPQPRVGVAIGDQILDLAAAAQAGWLRAVPAAALQQPTLNALATLGRATWTALRAELAALLQAGSPLASSPQAALLLLPQAAARMHLPFAIGGFTDFYASENHAYNCGCLFRDPANALPPNWKHIPIGYNGRASSVTLGGVPVVRPNGQLPGTNGPSWGPTQSLDFELEIGVFIGRDTELGQPLPIAQAQDAIFGIVLLNDWSAREVQRWEYAPLGPFQAKAFHTSISPWVVPLDALQPFRVALPEQHPTVLPYLQQDQRHSYDVQLDVSLQPATADRATPLSASNLQHLYWTFEQMIAHHASSGCNLRVGDLLGTGTISGTDHDALGCMLEMTRNGQQPLQLLTGEERLFLADGDTLRFSAQAVQGGIRIGFGELRSTVAPAVAYPQG